jgi:hypothetical protein
VGLTAQAERQGGGMSGRDSATSAMNGQAAAAYARGDRRHRSSNDER